MNPRVLLTVAIGILDDRTTYYNVISIRTIPNFIVLEILNDKEDVSTEYFRASRIEFLEVKL